VKKIILFLTIFFIFLKPLNADIKKNIITNLENTQNISFNFEQTINEKVEKGICIIEYPKKIYCEYDNFNKKLMISDGNSLVIINQKSNQYYRYPLKKTGLNFILDKNYLINQIKNLKGRIIDEKYYNFTLINNEIKINIFFDNKSLNLIGWQTEDIYQNLVITFISSIKINQKIKKNKFTLPKIK
jgi:outer membrane lipoprotein-sorting protein